MSWLTHSEPPVLSYAYCSWYSVQECEVKVVHERNLLRYVSRSLLTRLRFKRGATERRIWTTSASMTPSIVCFTLIIVIFPHRHVEDIDLFTGGLGEKPVIFGLVGPTFACILGQQFLNLRRGESYYLWMLVIWIFSCILGQLFLNLRRGESYYLWMLVIRTLACTFGL